MMRFASISRCGWVLVLVALVAVGCRSKASKPAGTGTGSGAKQAFLDQKKQVPPRKEWTREVTSRSGGTFSFRIASQGPFAVTVVTDKGFKALQNGVGNGPAKEDILLTVDSKEPVLEKSLAVQPGSTWFIIENQTDKNVEIQLQCFAQ